MKAPQAFSIVWNEQMAIEGPFGSRGVGYAATNDSARARDFSEGAEGVRFDFQNTLVARSSPQKAVSIPGRHSH